MIATVISVIACFVSVYYSVKCLMLNGNLRNLRGRNHESRNTRQNE